MKSFVRLASLFALVLGCGCLTEVGGTPCNTDSDCNGWEYCGSASRRCLAKSCTNDATCGAGAICQSNGFCAAGVRDAGGNGGADAGADAGAVADAGAGGDAGADAGDAGPVNGCVSVDAGEEPTVTSYCVGQDASTCLNDGRCDGTGSCRKWVLGTVVITSSCPGVNTYQGASTCNGDGGVVVPNAVSCGSYSCVADAGACPSSCGADSACVSGAFCNDGNCNYRQDAGAVCADAGANSCVTNICAQGVCCKTACGDAGRWCEGCEVGSGDCKGRGVVGWEKRVSTLGGATTRPSLVAVDGGYAYAAVSNGTSVVFLRMDRDGGAVKAETVIVDGGFPVAATRGPVMVAGGVSGGFETYYVGWWSTMTNSVYVTTVAVEIDGGAFGAAEFRYDDGGETSVDAWVGYGRASDGDAGVMVVWGDDENGAVRDIFFRDGVGVMERWPGGGGAGTRNFGGGAARSNPKLGYDGERGEYALAYEEGPTVYLQRVGREDGGVTGIGGAVNVSVVNTASEPSVAVGFGEVAVAWRDTKGGAGGTDGEIYFRRVDWDGGLRGDEVRVSNLNDGGGDGQISEAASLVWNGDGYAVAWHDRRNLANNEIYMTALWCAP
ncbi:MAG: hypothetical protein HYY84_00445 [Deltaproteobacteria bacterium]|nr:hypothetical protein [Deltaproteobacteria bacterium]